ncbi:MAG TPA: hypothetical protein VF662_06510 [Allosphingosinicella sp.]|jgi:hypothetical protein
MIPLSLAAGVALLALAPAHQSPVPAPVGAAEHGSLVLPAGTEVPLATLEELSSLTARQGQRFDLTVTDDVLARGYVVIPRGSRAVGEVRRVIGKGMVGKRGRIDMQLLFMEVGGHRIGIEGRTDDRGKSGAAPVVGTAVLAGAFGAFVTGTSAKLPKGTLVRGYTRSDLRLSVSR